MKKFIIIIALPLISNCIFYSMAGSIPPHIKSISIPMVENQTVELRSQLLGLPKKKGPGRASSRRARPSRRARAAVPPSRAAGASWGAALGWRRGLSPAPAFS